MTSADIGLVSPGRFDSADLIAHIETHSGFGEVEAPWSALQLHGLATPYQTLAWIRAWSETIAGHDGIVPLLVAARDQGGKVILLLPLGLRRLWGATVAEFLGGKHANFNMGLYDSSVASCLTSQDVKALLKAVAERHRIDLFIFQNQPLSWDGQQNPMAQLAYSRSSDSGWKGALARDHDALLGSILSLERRKKLRAKERKLTELGSITYSEAKTRREVDQALTAFLVQKRDRFHQLGIPNPFAEPGAEAFLRRGASPTATDTRSPIALFLMKADERVLAVFGGVIHRGRFTGMFTSYDNDPAVSRCSPGDLLLMNVVRMMCEQGLDTFDLGTGDAAYKSVYCPIEEPLFDTLLPFSVKGRLAAIAIGARLAFKRFVKRSAFAMAVVARCRRMLGWPFAGLSVNRRSTRQ
ncbi:MAG: GNAT family N-acetyltransferase [Methylocystis sp.]|nr:GNAT family N-acetyltransferase [Methylocystis sp.]MCA3589604.1 GNAT family N-acetyltransferase [Methylocystis sp.]